MTTKPEYKAGRPRCGAHLDGIVPDAMLALDGETVLEAGRSNAEALQVIAG